MQTFTLVRSDKSERVFIYNSDGTEIGQCVTSYGVFSYFSQLRKDLSCRSVTYSLTRDDNVILVKLK